MLITDPRASELLRKHGLAKTTLRSLLSHASGLGLRGYPQVTWDDCRDPLGRRRSRWLLRSRVPAVIAGAGKFGTVYSAAGLTLARASDPGARNEQALRRADRRTRGAALRIRADYGSVRKRNAVSCRPRDMIVLRDEVAAHVLPALAASGLYAAATDLALLYTNWTRLLTERIRDEVLRRTARPTGVGSSDSALPGFSECNGQRTCKHAGWSTGCWGAARGHPERGWRGGFVQRRDRQGRRAAFASAAVQWLTTHD